MTVAGGRRETARPLEVLGISELEEGAYSWLVTHPGATARDLADALAIKPGRVQRLLDSIEAKGLTTHSPERPRRYIPASPDIAMGALILQRQSELRRARDAVRTLQERAATARARDERERMVELVTSHEAAQQTYEQLHRTAQEEVIALVRPPLLISRVEVPAELDQHAQREAQNRGVRYRGIVDAELLSLPGAVDHVWADIKAGEEARAIPQLPFKMILADHRLALIPLDLAQPDGPSLLVRSSALLDALCALFELLWERAAPISFTSTGVLETGSPDPRLSEDTEKLLSLMAAGLNDKKIAHELGISASTLKRRIAELMKAFEVRTRFQLGRLSDRPAPHGRGKH